MFSPRLPAEKAWLVAELTQKDLDEIKNSTDGFKFGTDVFADLGKTVDDLKVGDRIYKKEKITNKHKLAFYLAIEHTKQEIARLYAATTGVNTQISGVSLHDVFKMDALALRDNKVHYQTKVLHKDERRDTQ